MEKPIHVRSAAKISLNRAILIRIENFTQARGLLRARYVGKDTYRRSIWSIMLPSVRGSNHEYIAISRYEDIADLILGQILEDIVVFAIGVVRYFFYVSHKC